MSAEHAGGVAGEIRAEAGADAAAVRHVNLTAFDGGPEAALVDRLRDACDDYLGFVAVVSDRVVGHVAFTPATLDNGGPTGMGLAPMAVLPSHQRTGIGTRLVGHGLDHLRRSGCPFVVVLGHPGYYPRFGFERASRHGLSSQWSGIPHEAFMVNVLDPQAMPANGGTVRYRDEFSELET